VAVVARLTTGEERCGHEWGSPRRSERPVRLLAASSRGRNCTNESHLQGVKVWSNRSTSGVMFLCWRLRWGQLEGQRIPWARPGRDRCDATWSAQDSLGVARAGTPGSGERCAPGWVRCHWLCAWSCPPRPRSPPRLRGRMSGGVQLEAVTPSCHLNSSPCAVRRIAGNESDLAIVANGTVEGWGATEVSKTSMRPVHVPKLKHVVQVAAGDRSFEAVEAPHECGLASARRPVSGSGARTSKRARSRFGQHSVQGAGRAQIA
jgi:hypothetical protein